MSSIEDLNRSVTAAIMLAESLTSGSNERKGAFRHVSEIEEEIAGIAGAGTLEGEIARVGAVSAALGAGEPLRALRLGTRYMDEGLTTEVHTLMETLLDQAKSDIESSASPADGDVNAPEDGEQ